MYQFIVLCEVDFMAEKQSCSATIAIFTPTVFSRLWHGRVLCRRYVCYNV